jgi:nucleotide-binding universal stress UspA family protein
MSSGIIVGYDGSEPSKHALEAATELAKMYGEPLLLTFAYELNRVAGEMKDYEELLLEKAKKTLADGRASLGSTTFAVEEVVVERAPGDALARLARERDARLIVVGTHGESPLRGFVIGSTPHKLLQISDRPVLVVPTAR